MFIYEVGLREARGVAPFTVADWEKFGVWLGRGWIWWVWITTREGVGW
jgi:hypothetical protein